jgi:hypothetical protein
MGKNPFDVCLSPEALEKVESTRSFREAREKTRQALGALNEARQTHLSLGRPVEHHREGDYEATLNRERSEAERLDQEARDKLHLAAREHAGPTRVPVVEPWTLDQEFTSDAPSEDKAPTPPVRRTFADLQKRRSEPAGEEVEPEPKGVTGLQVWGVFLALFFGTAWLFSVPGSAPGGVIISFLICAGLAIGIFQITVLFTGDSGIGGGGRGGGSFNGSAV